MVKHLVTKTAFAELAGVSVSAITKSTKRGALGEAMEGAKLNSYHPAAVAYLESRGVGSKAVNGLDPMYDECVAFCQRTGRWSATAISRNVKGLGRERAKAIFCVIEASGVKDLDGPVPVVDLAAAVEESKPKPKASGTQALKHNKIFKEAEAPHDNFADLPEDIRKLADWSLRKIIDTFGFDHRFETFLKTAKIMEDIHEKRIKNAAACKELISREIIHKGIIDPVDASHSRMLTDGAKTISLRLHARFKNGATPKEGERLIQNELTKIMQPMKKRIKNVLREL